MSKHLYCIKDVSKPRKFSVRLIRNRLSSFGLRGGALRSEVARIPAGPVDGTKGTYPFSWSGQHFDRRMKHILICASDASRLSDDRPIVLRRRGVLAVSREYLSV